ncbi:MAG: DUF2062 domain-containing protein [Phycisphaerae bacterium]|nr:DUF2062 domain-containing protein [Phycisphaerae bacterium]
MRMFNMWHRRQRLIKRDLRNHRLFRIWGHRLFANVLWKIDKKAVAGGLSLGLFVAFMPTIGIQMIMVTIGALYFKVNLAIALAACWVTNPLTAFPIYTAAWRLGRYILEDFTPIREMFDLYNIEGRAVRIMVQAIYLWTGCLVFSLVSAIGANIGVRATWNIGAKVRRRARLSARAMKKQARLKDRSSEVA